MVADPFEIKLGVVCDFLNRRIFEKLAKRYKAHKEDKVKAHVVEHEAYRHWDHWLSDGRVPHLFVVDVESGKTRDLFAGSRYELPRADPSAHHYDIAPDGGEIAFTFDPAEEKRFDHEDHLFALDLSGKRFRPLTEASKLSHSCPRYSPDGRTIALLTQDLKRSFVAEARLATIDRKSGRMYTSEAFLAAPSDTMYRDYGFFSTFGGPAGNRIAILSGSRDTAVMGVAEKLTHVKSLAELQKKLPGSSDFEALFEVKGQKHINLETRVLASYDLDSQSIWTGANANAASFPPK